MRKKRHHLAKRPSSLRPARQPLLDRSTVRVRRLRGRSLWLEAPVALLRFPGIFAAVTAATFVLGITSATAPMFQSSAGSAALAVQLAKGTPWEAGLTVFGVGPLGDRSPGIEQGLITPNELFRRRDELLRSDTSPLFGLGQEVLTITAGCSSAWTNSMEEGWTWRATSSAACAGGAVSHAPSRAARTNGRIQSALAQVPHKFVPLSMVGG